MGFRHVYSSQSKPVANSLYPGQLRSNIGLPAPIYSSQVNSIYASNELPGAI
ncbi:hypothetical protein DPMN_136943 [Dreissena polymorpha]|uniref:Uncharacterized protein n=1 Tax=Dreissena polymorpha TaxID=45954 RepID=A0A9D4G4A6_DREPO|nr:hypothetical protein DPMN_136943 [Dreissena polymorpha]